MNPSFKEKISKAHLIPKALPGVDEIDQFLQKLLYFLFPELNNIRFETETSILGQLNMLKADFEQLLAKTKACDPESVNSICGAFFDGLEEVYDSCMEDGNAILEGDPAAVDLKEVIRAYPGFYAIAVYRIAHSIYLLEVPYLPRLFTEHAHSKTGIEIHPGARIGRSFCIDHGTGVVIGETTEIGNHVKLYQGVTLGAVSIKKELAKTKRHPTIEDGVVVYAGATILGGKTTIGRESVIGGNVWITASVPPHSRVYYKSQGQQIVKEVQG